MDGGEFHDEPDGVIAINYLPVAVPTRRLGDQTYVEWSDLRGSLYVSQLPVLPQVQARWRGFSEQAQSAVRQFRAGGMSHQQLSVRLEQLHRDLYQEHVEHLLGGQPVLGAPEF